MSADRDIQFHTETPFLPLPIAGDVLELLTRPWTTLAGGEARAARISAYRAQVGAAIDTIELAISANHADYLGGRWSWSYETRIEVETRLKSLKRQRQHLQEALGHCNRRIKRLTHEQHMALRAPGVPDAARALRFVQIAQQVLDPDTLAMIWDAVEHQQATSNGQHFA
jgi:hypothetical protein